MLVRVYKVASLQVFLLGKGCAKSSKLPTSLVSCEEPARVLIFRCLRCPVLAEDTDLRELPEDAPSAFHKARNFYKGTTQALM